MIGSIPADRAVILWTEDDDRRRGHRIVGVCVCPLDAQPSWATTYENSRGACSSTWLNGAWNETPIGLFLEMQTLSGFHVDELPNALREFKKIAGQDWATSLLRQLGYGD